MTDKSSPKDLNFILASRLFAYNLLKRVFLEEPTKEFLDLLTTEGFLEAFPLADQNEEIRVGAAEIAEYLKDPNTSTDNLLTNLSVDFCGLLLGPGRPSAPPWESVYLSEKGLLFSEETIAIRREYEKYNLKVEKFQREPDDHIAYELDFIRHLCQLTINHLEKKDADKVKELLQSQKDFLTNHLQKWAPQFCQNAVKNARTNFYRGFAKILEGFLRADYSLLEDLLKN